MCIKKQRQIYLNHGDGENGDCYRTSLACLLNMDLSDVPHFYAKGTINPNDKIHDWILEKGYFLLEVTGLHELPIKYSKDKDLYHLISSDSPRIENCLHCVVGKNGEPYWDPHPSDDMVPINENTIYGFLIPLNGYSVI